MFDEYFNPPPSFASLVPTVVAPEPVDPTGTPSLTSIDQDAPSPSTSQTPQETQSPVIPSEPNSKESSSRIIETNVHSVNQPPKYLRKWTKDHPLDKVIGNPSRPVSTRHQLQTKAMFCYFDAFLASVEPKNYKEALKESFWIEAMQEELNEFERLEVKLDELGDVLKNKARLVTRGYRQEEGIDFEESFASVA
ncbi:retrovirus-related pol polyprotein from transposon TNT 1-94 [Tanacetum coccineum]